MESPAGSLDRAHQPTLPDVVEAGARALLYSAFQAPVSGVTQLVDHALGTSMEKHLEFFKPAQAGQFGSAQWHAVQIGGALGMAADFVAMSKLGVGLGGTVEKAETVALSSAAEKAALTGAVYQGVFQPVGDNENFLKARFVNAVAGGATFATLSGSALSLGMLGRTASLESTAVGSALRNTTFAGLLSGIPAGIVSAESTSLASKQQLASGQDAWRSAYSFLVAGGTMGLFHSAAPDLRQGSTAQPERAKIEPEISFLPKIGQSEASTPAFTGQAGSAIEFSGGTAVADRLDPRVSAVVPDSMRNIIPLSVPAHGTALAHSQPFEIVSSVQDWEHPVMEDSSGGLEPRMQVPRRSHLLPAEGGGMGIAFSYDLDRLSGSHETSDASAAGGLSPHSVFNQYKGSNYKFIPYRNLVGSLREGGQLLMVTEGGKPQFVFDPNGRISKIMLPKSMSEAQMNEAVVVASFAQLPFMDIDAFDAVSRVEGLSIGFNQRMQMKYTAPEEARAISIKGAQAYVRGEEGNQFTKYLNTKYGAWSDQDTQWINMLSSGDKPVSPWSSTVAPTPELFSSGVLPTEHNIAIGSNPAIRRLLPWAKTEAIHGLSKYVGMLADREGAPPSGIERTTLIGRIAPAIPVPEVEAALTIGKLSADPKQYTPEMVKTVADLVSSGHSPSYADAFNNLKLLKEILERPQPNEGEPGTTGASGGEAAGAPEIGQNDAKILEFAKQFYKEARKSNFSLDELSNAHVADVAMQVYGEAPVLLPAASFAARLMPGDSFSFDTVISVKRMVDAGWRPNDMQPVDVLAGAAILRTLQKAGLNAGLVPLTPDLINAVRNNAGFQPDNAYLHPSLLDAILKPLLDAHAEATSPGPDGSAPPAESVPVPGGEQSTADGTQKGDGESETKPG